MKRNLIIAVLLCLAAAMAQAADLTWDPAGGGTSDGGGTWLNAGEWWDGGGNVTWNNGTPDNATIGNGGSGGTITLGAVTAGTVTFTNHSGNYVLSGGALTNSGGITIGASAGNASLMTAIHGAGGVIKNSSGDLTIANTGNSYSGATVVSNGTLKFGTGWNNSWTAGSWPGGSNLEINDGTLQVWFPRSANLGTGGGEVQLTGGRCGFVMAQGDRPGAMWTINGTDAFEVQWGTNTFNPTELVMCDGANQSAPYMYFVNKFDLNGANRFIGVGHATRYGRMSGVLRNTAGTPAGIVKTGIGELQLTAANTFDGGIIVSNGTLAAGNMQNGGLSSSIGSSSSSAANILLGDGATLKYTGGNTSTDRGFTINGTSNGVSAALDASGSGAITFSNSSSPAYGIAGQSRTLILTGTSTNANTLAANVADNSGGEVSLTKKGTGTWLLTGNCSYSGDTIVTNGVLRLSDRGILPSATTLYLYAGGSIDLPFTGSQNLAALFIDGVRQPNGVYGDNGSTITGTGFLSPGSLGTVLRIK